MPNPKEVLLWSIALPGFGQFLNGKLIKGIVFVFLEYLINVNANFNVVIISSFHGDIEKAIAQTDYLWIMFYPCLYFFAMWDAFKDAGGGSSRYSYLPFVFCTFFVTVGCIYSTDFKIFGFLLGPIWLPILCVIPGTFTGFLLMKVIKIAFNKQENQ